MQAGFGYREVLAMLTTAPSELLHLSQREGKVMPGMRGDLDDSAQKTRRPGTQRCSPRSIYDPWRQRDLAPKLGGKPTMAGRQRKS